MKIIDFPINKPLQQANEDMKNGTPDNVLEHAQFYLHLLDEHMAGLRKLKWHPEADGPARSNMEAELTQQIRTAIKCEIEGITSERNRIEALIESFTMVSGWSAAETLNSNNFKNACDWESFGSGVRSIANGAELSIADAVDEAKRLRREGFFSPPVATAI